MSSAHKCESLEQRTSMRSVSDGRVERAKGHRDGHAAPPPAVPASLCAVLMPNVTSALIMCVVGVDLLYGVCLCPRKTNRLMLTAADASTLAMR